MPILSRRVALVNRPRRAPAALVVAAALLVGACQGGATQGPSVSGGGVCPGGPPISVVTTTTVFADMIENVGGPCVQAVSVVPRGADVHTFEPRPNDLRTVAQAKLLVMNGLGLDTWLQKLITNASADGTPLLQLGVDLPGVTPLPGEEPGSQNPHLWLDVLYGQAYVARIAATLEQVDPANAPTYRAGAATYTARLAELDAYVRAQVALIPEADRKLVTFHDAFPYYAREYGITIVGVAVEAPGQDPSAAETGALIEAIKASGVKAIFSEKQFPTRLVDQLAAETGARVVANLYDDSLGDSPVDSYVGVITWDTDQLVQALR
ncbi:MAG: metal ABC transporter substrate-binding protein [Candidatus Limnocylindrales bacterium]